MNLARSCSRMQSNSESISVHWRPMKLTFNSFCDHVFIYFRRRMNRFLSLFSPSSEVRVLDIGGTAQTWTHESKGCALFSVTLINVRSNGQIEGSRFAVVEGDTTAMPFPDDAFDIAFSDSVIEQAGAWGQQQAFAREARRVARKLWIQTPARSFPLEAHLLAPYIQYLPKSVQHRIVRWTRSEEHTSELQSRQYLVC